jgi:hypothetical protein
MKNLKTFAAAVIMSIILTGTVLSQTATDQVFRVFTDSLVIVNSTQLTFNVYLKNIWPSAVQLGGVSLGYDFNNTVLSGGTGTLAIVSSGLPANVQPKTPSVAGGNKLALNAAVPPGAGSGYFMNSGDSVLVDKLSLSTNTILANSTLILAYRQIPTLAPRFVFSIYVGTTNIGLTTAQTTAIGPSFDAPLPVNLASFTANVNARDVSLNWKTEKEINNKGFDVERKSTDGSWTKVGYVEGKGNTSSITAYKFDDKKLDKGKYSYRLKQTDYNGNFEYHILNSTIEVGVPTKFNISQNYPNPFNPTTKIDYDLPRDSKVSIKLYDITGREVSTLVNEPKTAGYYTVDYNAATLSSGTYFYRIVAESSGENFVLIKKMMLVK